MNCTRFQGKETDVVQIKDLADTLPFFSDYRLIIVENSGLFKSANDLADYLPNMPDSTILLFVESEIDKRNRLYKYVNKSGYAVEMKPMNDREIKLWTVGILKQAGKQMRENTAEYFLGLIDNDMYHVKNELDKLIGFVGDREEITKEDVDEIACVQVNGQIFQMMDAVASGDQRGVDINEVSLLEELMDRIGAEGTNTEYCLEGVGSRTQMGNGTKVFHGVAFFLQRVIRCGNALYGNFCCLNFKWLFCLRCCNEGTLYDDGCANVHFRNLSKVFHLIVVHNLQCFKIASVVQNDETKGFGITYAADPAAYGYFFVQVCFPVFINLSDGCKFHCFFLPKYS